MDFIFDPSLVFYLPFYRLDGVSFMSKDAYGHLCTVTGALWTPRGRSFDGSDDFTAVANHSCFNITNDLTLEVWMKSAGGGGGYSEVISRLDPSVNQGYSLVQNNDNSVGLFLADGTVTQATGREYYSANTWVHLVCVFVKPTGTVYKDGISGTTLTMNNPIANYDHDPWIGKRHTNNACFPGSIGEVRIYNRAFTPSEILHNYLTTRWRYQ